MIELAIYPEMLIEAGRFQKPNIFQRRVKSFPLLEKKSGRISRIKKKQVNSEYLRWVIA